MEVVFTRRYKINLLFSLVISLTAGMFTAYASPYLLDRFFPGTDNLKGAAAVIVFLALHLTITGKYRRRKKIVSAPFPSSWRDILSRMVPYYRILDDENKYIFEKKVQIFLAEKRITGIETEVDDSTRLLIASAAVIPVFKIDDWEYDTLGEILVYPDRFDRDYSFTSDNRDVLGMVVQHTSSLIISKKELFRGFASDDSSNTAIHEFMHKIDEEDGEMDGLPVLMLDREGLEEWKKIRASELEMIEDGSSDMNPYALTGGVEFLAVAGEYFFKQPERMKERNPDLYNILKRIFKQDNASVIRSGAVRLFSRKK